MKTEDIVSDVDNYILGTYSRIPLTIKEGKGSWVWDNDGNKFLDYTTGIAVNNLGHNNSALTGVIKNQAEKIIHSSNLFYLESQANLAKNLVENSFADKVFFCNTGTEAVEGAIKFARKWGSENGGKFKILSTTGSFHGRTFGALSATGSTKYHEGFKPMLEGFDYVPYGDAESVAEYENQEELCALIVEPIQGENGVIVPQSGYLKDLKSICTEKNILLILDEIQVGMGRTGTLFAYEHEGIDPDIITLAKGLGGGVPCGAVLLNEKVAVTIKPGSHGTTFGGNPLAVSCAYETLKIINSAELLQSVVEHGNYFKEKLNQLQGEYKDLIAQVRGKGLIIGIEFTSPEIARKTIDKTISEGLLTIHTAGNVMRILPPLNTNKEEIDFALEIINKSLKEVHSDA